MSETTTAEKAIDQQNTSSESVSVVDVERNIPVPVPQEVVELPKPTVPKGTKTQFSIWSKIYYTAIPCFLSYLM